MSSLIRLLTGRAGRRRSVGLYFTLATTGFRLVRRVTSPKQRTLLRFEVKPGDAFEIRGVRRGR